LPNETILDVEKVQAQVARVKSGEIQFPSIPHQKSNFHQFYSSDSFWLSSSPLGCEWNVSKMPAATNAFVVSISEDGGNAKMTAWALQGMINQQSAEVYLINNPWIGNH